MQVLNVRTMKKSEGGHPSDLGPQTGGLMQAKIVQSPSYTDDQDTALDLPENTILQTTKYGMFRLDATNRKISQDKLDRMYAAIEKRNLLHLFPIVVSRNLTVIDGQHRLKVAEALNTPIYYIISDQMRIEDAAFINGVTDTWKGQDWLHHWCALGLPEYLKVKEFWGRHQWLTFSSVRGLCFRGDTGGREEDGSSVARRWQSGEYVANNIAEAEKICGMAKDFSTWVKFWKERPFLSALRNLNSNAAYDHDRMIRKMQYLSSRLVKCATADDYLAVMSTIYNYKVAENERVVLSRISHNNANFKRPSD